MRLRKSEDLSALTPPALRTLNDSGISATPSPTMRKGGTNESFSSLQIFSSPSNCTILSFGDSPGFARHTDGWSPLRTESLFQQKQCRHENRGNIPGSSSNTTSKRQFDAYSENDDYSQISKFAKRQRHSLSNEKLAQIRYKRSPVFQDTCRVIVVDLKVTGSDPDRDEISEIAAVELINSVRTGVMFHAQLSISTTSESPYLSISTIDRPYEVLRHFWSFVGQKTPIILHNADIDLAFLKASTVRHVQSRSRFFQMPHALLHKNMVFCIARFFRKRLRERFDKPVQEMDVMSLCYQLDIGKDERMPVHGYSDVAIKTALYLYQYDYYREYKRRKECNYAPENNDRRRTHNSGRDNIAPAKLSIQPNRGTNRERTASMFGMTRLRLSPPSDGMTFSAAHKTSTVTAKTLSHGDMTEKPPPMQPQQPQQQLQRQENSINRSTRSVTPVLHSRDSTRVLDVNCREQVLSNVTESQRSTLVHFLQTSTTDEIMRRCRFLSATSCKLIVSKRPFIHFDRVVSMFESVPILGIQKLHELWRTLFIQRG